MSYESKVNINKNILKITIWKMVITFVNYLAQVLLCPISNPSTNSIRFTLKLCPEFDYLWLPPSYDLINHNYFRFYYCNNLQSVSCCQTCSSIKSRFPIQLLQRFFNKITPLFKTFQWLVEILFTLSLQELTMICRSFKILSFSRISI